MTPDGRRVLLVEDSPTQAQRVQLLLEGEGYHVELARDGREGLAIVRTRPPDLVISDVLMPEMDGYALCQALKSGAETRKIPLILFTERQEPRDILEGLLRGADNFIPKSASDEYLLERVGRIFEQLELRQRGRLDVEFVVRVGGRDVILSADKQQIFELMISGLEETSRVNDQLRESQRLLEERAEQLVSLNQELETFSYSVSHDLRAPLRHIGGFVHFLQKGCAASLDETGRSYLTRIARAAEHMAQLIEDLLAFSRLGRAELRGSRVDVGALVAEIAGQLREQDPGRAVFFQIGTLPEVAADPAMLRMALTNLIANAMKYTRKCPRAEIEIGHRSDGEDYVVIFVRDNGAGFDMRYANRLFGVFQRLHRDDEFEGTGIGLATVRRIVHRHGGQVWAEGELDRGAMFSFSMPRWSGAAPGPAAKV